MKSSYKEQHVKTGFFRQWMGSRVFKYSMKEEAALSKNKKPRESMACAENSK